MARVPTASYITGSVLVQISPIMEPLVPRRPAPAKGPPTTFLSTDKQMLEKTLAFLTKTGEKNVVCVF